VSAATPDQSSGRREVAASGRREVAASGRRLALPGPGGAVIVVTTLAAFGLRLAPLAGPGLLGVTGYDDGAYFGSALRLLQGSAPYRDFVLVQPPGITLLLVPAALLAKAAGAAWGMAAARLLTAAASAAGVALAGLLARHRGAATVAAACTVIAVYPGSLAAARSVFVEPWLTLLCLAGAVAVFDGDRLTASRRRLAAAGLLLGCAGAVEAWAVFPFGVLLVLAAALPSAAGGPRGRRLTALGAGAVAGFGVPVLPFAAAAPRGIYQSLVLSQLGRVTAATPLPARLRVMTAAGLLPGVSDAAVIAIAVALAAAITGAVAAGAVLTRSPPPALEVFVLATAALTVAAFVWYPQFFSHFAAFLAPFLALAVALPAARLAAARTARHRPRAGQPGWSWAAMPVAGLAIWLGAASQPGTAIAPQPRLPGAFIAAGRRLIPAGACVATDEVSILIAADRFSSAVPGCSPMVDGLGTDYVLAHGRAGDTGAGRFPAVAAAWRAEFAQAGFAWLTGPYNAHRIAWNQALRAWFQARFRPLLRDRRHDVLYVRRS
jgi:alpha-1,2-mannosyltransferase